MSCKLYSKILLSVVSNFYESCLVIISVGILKSWVVLWSKCEKITCSHEFWICRCHELSFVKLWFAAFWSLTPEISVICLLDILLFSQKIYTTNLWSKKKYIYIYTHHQRFDRYLFITKLVMYLQAICIGGILRMGTMLVSTIITLQK